MKREKPIKRRIGGLTIMDLTGEPFDEQEIVDALRNADYSHLPRLRGGKVA